MFYQLRALFKSKPQPPVAPDPVQAERYFQLGNSALARKDWALAEEKYRQAVIADNSHAEAHANLGGLLKDQGENEQAIFHFENALAQKPDLAPASFNLAMIYVAQMRWEAAIPLLRSTLHSDPKQPHAAYWLGNALMALGDSKAACESYKTALTLDSKFVQARWGFTMAQLPAVPTTLAEQDAAVKNFSRELQKLKSWFLAHRTQEAHLAVGAQQPYYLAYIPENHKQILSAYGALATQLIGAWSRHSDLPPPSKERATKCRVGIVSAHIFSHSVWHALVRGWVEHLDADTFDVHIFHTGQHRDAQTQWASERVKCLHYQQGDWMAWAKAIADQKMDVLVYPEIGMDATTVRLSALRLARVQLASWGHPITTGLPTIDGFVSALAFEPAHAEQHYTEKLITLPRLGCCYQAYGTQAVAFDLSKWNISTRDSLLLSAGTPFKYAPKDDQLLVDIARRCSPCKIILFKDRAGPLSLRLESRLRDVFEAAGLAFDDFVRFIPWQEQASFFGLMDQAHVYLDTVGFSGFNTTMQAIERALPVVAWEGQFMRGRFASSILNEAGLGAWVSTDTAGYLDRVERLCKDQSLREQYRQQIITSRSTLFQDQETVKVLGQQLLTLA